MRFASTFLLLMLLATPACGPKAKPDPQPKPDLPKISEVMPRPLDPDGQPTREPANNARLVVQRLLFDRDDGRLDLALAALPAAKVDAGTLNAWRVNGLNVGVIEQERLALFIANLPKTLARYNTLINRTPHYVPVEMVGRVPDGLVARVSTDGKPPKARRFIAGRFQFLMKLNPGLAPDDPVHVELVPHHFGPRDSIVPRMPHEKMLDGTVFTELTIDQPMDSSNVWVIWGDVDRAAIKQYKAWLAQQKLQEPPPLDQQVQRPPPPLLGQCMTTGKRGRKPVRVVLLMQVQQSATSDE